MDNSLKHYSYEIGIGGFMRQVKRQDQAFFHFHRGSREFESGFDRGCILQVDTRYF